MDALGWFIAELHAMLGHDKVAAVLGQPAGDKGACLICRCERTGDEADRQAVIAAIGGPGSPVSPS
jgi:hypothetical protein